MYSTVIDSTIWPNLYLYGQAQQIKAREHQQQMQMQQLQLIQQRHAQMQRTNSGHPSLNGPINGLNSDSILGPSTASVLAAKMYEERLKHPHSMDSEGSQLMDASRMALIKSAPPNHTGSPSRSQLHILIDF
jgi:hypothetical protein